MRAVNVLISAFHLIVTIFVFLVGLFFFILPHAHSFIDYFIAFLSSRADLFIVISVFFFSLSLILFLGFYTLYKNQYFKMQISNKLTFVDTELIKEYLQKYLDENYIGEKIYLSKVVISNKNIEIIASLKKEKINEEFLEDFSKKIKAALKEELDYMKDFYLNISFNY